MITVTDLAPDLPATVDQAVAEFHAELVGEFQRRREGIWATREIIAILNDRVQALMLTLHGVPR